jgi:hypothetical protein
VLIVRRAAWPAATLAAGQLARYGFRQRIMAAAAMLAVAGPGGLGGPSRRGCDVGVLVGAAERG